MVVITNKSNKYAITICGQLINPQTSHSFEKVDMNIVNYYISTGDIDIKVVKSLTSTARTKTAKRQTTTQDTIIIDSANTMLDSSEQSEAKI